MTSSLLPRVGAFVAGGLILTATLAACQGRSTTAMAPPAADADMQQVLDAHAALNPKAPETLTPQEARRQPSPADGAKAVMKQRGIMPEAGVSARNVMYAGAGGQVAARIYQPEGVAGPKPVLLYFRGGGWVIADLDTYDATPRALAKQLKAVVISADYRMAPEHPFPASHDDAVAAYKWVLSNAASWGGDVERFAVAGESAGGNLAAHVVLAARDQQLRLPRHLLLVYPVASTDTDTPSYHDCAAAKPLNASMMAWFFKHEARTPADLNDKRLNLVQSDFRGLPPTTIISAQIDPLRSDGDMLTARLKNQGVEVQHRIYDGATHEFFGMAAVVGKAKQAQEFAVTRLNESLAKR